MELKIYNTLSRRIETFIPIDSNNVRIYSCGPTVYGEPHIGNMRKYFLDDLLKNVIKHILSFHTTHVVNITDVGHLTGENEWDADHGEDKMEKWARRDGVTAWDVAKKYENLFHTICRTLLLDPFDITPRATEHILEQISMISDLEKKGYTYIIPHDWVYMDTSKVDHYDCLVWKKHIEWLLSGARIDNSGRKNPTDFALWKFNTTGKKRDMERESPRWIGFPGWHIECSAMSIKYLWNHFDIHTGGIDHIPIHHTNEIAQSQCSISSTPWVNYWIHYQFLNIVWQKISKSIGNTITIQDILDKWFSIYDLRYFYLQAHYRSFQDFTRDALEAAKRGRLSLIKKIQDGLDPDAHQEEEILGELLNDLNTWWMLWKIHVYGCPKWLDEQILKLWLFEIISKEIISIPDEIKEIAQQRRTAKINKDWSLSDQLRDKLKDQGRNMLDGKEWFELTPNIN